MVLPDLHSRLTGREEKSKRQLPLDANSSTVSSPLPASERYYRTGRVSPARNFQGASR